MARPIDLHAHSDESDGTRTPAELVYDAHDAGLGVVAITDHDTVAGWPAARQAARETGVGLIPGIEFSSQIGPRSVHVLGYLLNPESPAFLAERERVREARLDRLHRMVDLIGGDYPLRWEHIEAVTHEGATVGRPHIADALIELGVVESREDAFSGILHWQGGYYVPHEAPDPADAVRLIGEAGGVAVIAHPAARGRPLMERGNFERILDAGLHGVEVFHRDNPPADQRRLLRWTAEFDLIVTGSSDWHGAGKPNQLGEHTTAPDQLARILELGTGTEPELPAGFSL